MTDIHIPPAALEAGARAICAGNKWGEPCATPCSDCLPEARAAFLAIVEAWEGMKLTPWWEFTTHKRRVDLVLPLPEKVDG